MPLRRTDTKRLLCVYGVLVAAALAGCAVGPDFRRPAPPAVSSYMADALPGETVESKVAGGGTQRFVSGEDIPPLWWALFRSEALDRLIRQALEDSPTLSAAQATLRVAEENRRAQFGALFPQVDANASASRQQVSGESFGQTGNTNPTFTLYNASVNVSYDLDLFGGTRRAVEAAGAEVDFQRFQLEGAWLTLTSNLVVTAMQEASLRAQIRATREILTAEEQQLALVERQLQLGGTALVEVLPQRAQVAQTRVLVPALEKRLAQTRHLLAILAGRFPADAADLPEFELEGLQLPGELPVSLPSSLARQRPDILAAEALLHVASARIGVATANLYPQLTLTGSFGSQALQASDLFASGTSVWNLGAGVLQPLFRGGELTAKRRAAIAAYDQAVAQYRETVLQAFREVADVLKALESDAVTLKAQAEAEAAARESLDLAQKQFRYGASSYLSLLNAQRQYLLARIGLVQVQTLRYSDTAALFQALGGGWWNREPEGDAKPTSRERLENPDTGVVRP